MGRIGSFLIALVVALPLSAAAETYLLMAEEPGCIWCERWNTEISHIYPKTEVGELAPLKRFDLSDGAPEVELARKVHFTPTFILVRDGQELDRIEGYPGEDFFWGLLERMLDRAGIPTDQAG